MQALKIVSMSALYQRGGWLAKNVKATKKTKYPFNWLSNDFLVRTIPLFFLDPWVADGLRKYPKPGTKAIREIVKPVQRQSSHVCSRGKQLAILCTHFVEWITLINSWTEFLAPVTPNVTCHIRIKLSQTTSILPTGLLSFPFVLTMIRVWAVFHCHSAQSKLPIQSGTPVLE